MNQNSGKTHCIHGHEFTPENTYTNGNGRGCVACRTQYNKDRHKRLYIPRPKTRVYTKKEVCKRGHLRIPENLYPSGMCIECMKERRLDPEIKARKQAQHLEYYQKNTEKYLEDAVLRAAALKLEVLTHYGPLGILGCCWEECNVTDLDMLSLDHINNDGAQHRKKLGPKVTGGEKMYRIVKRNGFPEGFQTLCMNHQLKKKIEKDRSDRLQRNGERFGT